MSHALKLDLKLKSQISSEIKITHEILLTLQELDLTQSYRELGYSSLYEYLTKRHGYSEGAANRRIQASRLIRSCPEVVDKIQQGKLNLSQLALMQSAIKQTEKKSSLKVTKEKKTETLHGLVGLNHFETQKVLINTFNSFEVPKPQVIPIKNKKIQVNLEFNEKDWDQVQGLLKSMSHKIPDQRV